MIKDDCKPFPIQSDAARDAKGEYARPITHLPACTIPWWLAEIAYEEYAKRFGTDQSLERLAERGGFGRRELITLLRKEKF